MTSKREGTLLRKAIRKAAQGLMIGQLAEVVSYDPTTRSGSVQPLMVDPESGERPAPTTRIPFFHSQGGPFIISAPPSPGDACIVMWLDRSVDEWLVSGSADAEPASKWRRSASDAVAWVGVAPFSDSIPGVSPDDLVLGLKDGSALVSITPAGGVTVLSSDIRLGSSGASDPVVLLSELRSYITGLNAALNEATAGGYPLMFSPLTPLPLPASVQGAAKVKAE